MDDSSSGAGPALPPVLYLPTQHIPEGSTVEFVLVRLPDGRTALPVYSALDRLVSACGESQPWVALPAERVEVIHRASPFDLIALDPELPSESSA